MICRILIFNILLFSFNTIAESNDKEAPKFSAMDYFDRSLIVDLKISEIRETTHKHRNWKEAEEPFSCITFIYKFDSRGNMTNYTLNRLGTDYGFVYDENNDLIDWTWIDKMTGEVTSFKNEFKSQPDEFAKGIKGRSVSNNKMLSNVIPYTNKHIRTISDICFNIEAEYEISHDKTSGKLPLSAVASKVRDVGRFQNSDYKSPELLYISYEYEFHE